MTHREHYRASMGALLVMLLWACAALGGCPHMWLVSPVYLTVSSQ